MTVSLMGEVEKSIQAFVPAAVAGMVAAALYRSRERLSTQPYMQAGRTDGVFIGGTF